MARPMSIDGSSSDLFERLDRGPFDGDRRRQKIEQAHLLDTLVEHPGWTVLEQLVGEDLRAWERRILQGNLEPDVYRRQSGYVLGLRAVLDTPGEYSKFVARELAAETEEQG